MNKEIDMNRSGHCGGFTLLEVQITIVLVVVAVVGLAGAMVTSSRCQAASRERQVVSHALASQLETITQTPFDQIATRHGGAQFEIPGVLPTASTRPAGRVQVVVRDPDFLEVTVSGAWKGLSGPESFDLFQEVSR
jgi:type II secretory pathway pseudopilin PulG